MFLKGESTLYERPTSHGKYLELFLWPFEWLNQIHANGFKRSVNKKKGCSIHCLDNNYARMWFIHIVAN